MEHRSLGRNGPSVSVLGLGVASFGDAWGSGWTTDLRDARDLLRAAVDLGITWVDTASVYNRGRSEEWLGALMARDGLRDDLLVATKFGYRTAPDDPHAGGSGVEAMRRSVTRSLRRLRTDHVDVLYLHLWDGVTPPEETWEAASDLVDEGLVGSFALSNVPAWYAALVHGRATALGGHAPVCLQMHHNLLVREWEDEFVDLLRHTGTGLVCWGPLANGLLTDRYVVDEDGIRGEGRMTTGTFTTGSVDPFSERTATVRTELGRVAREVGRPVAEVALAWLLGRRYVSSVMLGVTSVEQLQQASAAVDLRLDAALRARLDAASAVPVHYPHTFVQDDTLRLVHGDRLPPDRAGRHDADPGPP
ncbi:MAG: aldo/keto reductase [Propionibacteriales bacterium]|nr:aldo/keto reductase [Propionibacteriales bacterium]